MRTTGRRGSVEGGTSDSSDDPGSIAERLGAGGVESPEAEARWIARGAGGRDVDELVRRRLRGEPLQYVLGTAAFRRLELRVGPGVFVPRPETELVADRAMARLPRGGLLVDLCTGSGAIALSVADERPDARVVASELSPAAAQWATSNRDSLGLRVELFEGDLFSALPSGLAGRVDVVVSNPPYVDPDERAMLPSDVVDHEPEVALFAPGEGTSVIERIASGAAAWLRRGGWIVLEIGETQGDAVHALLQGAGFDDVSIEPDLNGRDRMAEGRWPG
ncbi:MAG TPA: peptide chain release factor N(5)-glutamine methyltransferase [Actinomycetota bacterium]|nr:peptide chain release factor N(5)-glutamine methyltransferase [Actinomycetota bacterium]